MVDSKARRSFIGLLKGMEDLMKADTLYTYKDGESLHKLIMEAAFSILKESFNWSDKDAHPFTGSRRHILVQVLVIQTALTRALNLLGDAGVPF